jgi:hypothetical protein
MGKPNIKDEVEANNEMQPLISLAQGRVPDGAAAFRQWGLQLSVRQVEVGF